jgi:hypothetical protein
MAETVGDVAVRVGADITDLKSGMRQASASVGMFGDKSTKQFKQVAGNIAKVGLAAAAAGAALTVHLVNNAREAIDAQAKMAQQLNTTSASLATLKRAGELSGVEMKTITTASRTLSVRIGEAEQGLASAKDAFDALGLSASQLSDLPLDQRISTINNALLNNVDASQRAAIAADLFGTRAATAMKMLDDGTLDRARHEAELFGLALSDVDAAKVEQANDAMSTIGNAVDGIAQQFTIQLAPVLKAIGDQFLEMAEESGGFGKVAEDAMGKVVDGIAFVMNGVDGLKRIFEIVADGIIAYWSGLSAAIVTPFLEAVRLIDQIPGVDLSNQVAALEGFRDTAIGVAREAATNIEETLMEPMAGDKFKQFVEDAKVAGQAAAEAAVQARKAVGGDVVPMSSARDPKEIADINKRLDAIRVANQTELEMAEEKFILENEAIKEGLEAQQITREQAYELSNGAAERYAEAKLAIEQAAADREVKQRDDAEARKKAILSQAFGGLTALMNSESRKMFEIGKAASISQAVIATHTGMAEALKLGWPLGPIAAGAIALNGFAQVANIRKQSFGGGGSSSATGSTTGQINAANAPVGGAAGGETRNTFVTLSGINPNSFIQAGGLVDALNKELKDGGQINGVRFAA